MCLHPIQTSVALTSELRVVYCFMFPSLSETPSHPLVSLLLVCHVHIQCTCMYLSVSFSFLIYFWGAFVSPCWQRGITGPGIENSSQAFGWRSTLQTKRMLVHLKVATEVPADVFAVTLNNSALFGFHFQSFLQEACLWLLYGLVCCVFMWVLCSSVFPFHCQSHSI